MMQQNIPPAALAAYPGTFDPITLGHEDIIARAARMFGGIIVAVAAAHHKKTMFTLAERIAMTKEVLKDVPNVTVMSYDGLMRDFVRANGIAVMVRGVRGSTDFDYEMQLAGMNRSLMPDVETIFLPPNARYQYISSTYVREIATMHGEVEQFVHPHVYGCLLARVREREQQAGKP